MTFGKEELEKKSFRELRKGKTTAEDERKEKVMEIMRGRGPPLMGKFRKKKNGKVHVKFNYIFVGPIPASGQHSLVIDNFEGISRVKLT